jgi:hypothetical protein
MPVRRPLAGGVKLAQMEDGMATDWAVLAAYFFGGAFLCNAIPHFVAGVSGRPFQSPFARPPGEGLSSSTVNVLWGFANLVAAYFLVLWVGTFDLRVPEDAEALGAGILLLGLFTGRSFGRFNGGNKPTGK